MRWYTMSKPEDRQGTVCCEGDGRTVAVTYDAKDAKMIAECPRMLDALLAIRARVEGEFDHPALVLHGPLSIDRAADCLAIAQNALRDVEVWE